MRSVSWAVRVSASRSYVSACEHSRRTARSREHDRHPIGDGRVSRSPVTAVECWAPPKSSYLPDSVPTVSIDSDQISGIKRKKYYLPDRDNAFFVPVNSTRGQITPLSCYLAEVDTSLGWLRAAAVRLTSDVNSEGERPVRRSVGSAARAVSSVRVDRKETRKTRR